MYICSQVTSSRDGFLVFVYYLQAKAFGKEEKYLFYLKPLLFFYLNFYSIFLYLLGANVTSVISVISLLLLLIG